jgi:hypothetical protein
MVGVSAEKEAELQILPLCGLLCVPSLGGLLTTGWGRRLVLATGLLGCALHLPAVYLETDCTDFQPGIVSARPVPPGSWENVLFLSAFFGPYRTSTPR